MVKTMQFEPSTAVYDACRVIRERVLESPDRTRWDAFLSMFFVVYLWKPVSETELKR